MSIEELRELGVETSHPLPSDEGVSFDNEPDPDVELNFNEPE